jgi:hypothetical protein
MNRILFPDTKVKIPDGEQALDKLVTKLQPIPNYLASLWASVHMWVNLFYINEAGKPIIYFFAAMAFMYSLLVILKYSRKRHDKMTGNITEGE